MSDQLEDGEIFNEIITIRPITTTRPAIEISISQRIQDGKIAMTTAIIYGALPLYYEKPDILEDIAHAFIVAAYLMKKQNHKVKNGNR